MASPGKPPSLKWGFGGRVHTSSCFLEWSPPALVGGGGLTCKDPCTTNSWSETQRCPIWSGGVDICTTGSPSSYRRTSTMILAWIGIPTSHTQGPMTQSWPSLPSWPYHSDSRRNQYMTLQITQSPPWVCIGMPERDGSLHMPLLGRVGLELLQNIFPVTSEKHV